jgi:hypothetical protein
MTKLWRIRQVEYAGRMLEMRNAYTSLVGNLKVTDHLRDIGVDETIILEWIVIAHWYNTGLRAG